MALSSMDIESNKDASAMNVRSRIKGRPSPGAIVTSECSNDMVPLLREEALEDAEALTPNSINSSDSNKKAGEEPGRSSNKNMSSMSKSLFQWVKLLVLSWLISHVFYLGPGIWLEFSYFPARGLMLPNGFADRTFVPDIHYTSPSAAASDESSSFLTATTTATTTSAIPHIVHVTYKSREELPPEWEQSIQQWEEKHPTWEVRFWSDQDIAQFVHEQFPQYEEMWKSYRFMIQRVDSVRYMILYHFGGIYSDMDIYPATALDNLLQQWQDRGRNVLLAESLNMGVTNAFMAAAPQSKFMNCVIENLPHYQHQLQHKLVLGWQHWEILTSAGSNYLWGMFGHCRESDEDVEILAARSFRLCSACEAWETGKPATTCDTEWLRHSSTNSSWHQHQSWFHTLCLNVTYIFLCRPFRACFVSAFLLLVLLRRSRNKTNTRQK